MAEKRKQTRGLTWRSLVVTLVAIFMQAAWISYAERYNTYGSFAENSPPNSAMAVILVVISICGVLAMLRRSLRLTGAEMVIVYAALVVSAPLMTQGLWGRMAGLLAAIPNNADFKTYDNMPKKLWPHGPNLITNGRFEREFEGFEAQGEVSWEEADAGRLGRVKVPVLSVAEQGEAELRFKLGRFDHSGREVLVPGERFLLSLLIRAEGLQRASSYTLALSADDGPERILNLSTSETRPTFAQPGGFERIGASPVTVPLELERELSLLIRLNGAGRLSVYDIELMNVEAVESIYSGRHVVKADSVDELGSDERGNLVVRPDSLVGLAGLRYLMTGYIPLRQWLQPALAWSLLIAAMFAGFFGFNLLMRRQWVESERFTFPLTIVPRHLFAQDETGRWVIWRNRIMWFGFGLAAIVALLKGLHYYNPAIPELGWELTPLAPLVENPLAKAYFKEVSLPMLSLTVLSIGLLIQTDILFSLWSCFFLFQLFNLAGPALNMNQYPGYPWKFQQAMGAFIAYAMLALFVGRRHLREALRLAFTKTVAAAGRGNEVREHRLSLAMILFSFAALAWWGWWTGMGVKASLLFFGYIMILGFATSKIRAECGSPLAYLTPYFGMQFVAATGGFAMFGPTGMLVATIASGFMTVSCFLLIAPVQIEMIELGRHFGVPTRQVGTGLWLGLLGGVFVGGFVVLCWAYGMGGDSLEVTWPYQQNWYYNTYRAAELAADRAMTTGSLVKPETACMNIFANPDAKGLALGAVITLILALFRSLFMWFPFHPLGYVLSSSHHMQNFWLAALIAWVIRIAVLKIGGARAIREGLTPFCVGMFLACVVSIIFFDVIGLFLQISGVTGIYNGIP